MTIKPTIPHPPEFVDVPKAIKHRRKGFSEKQAMLELVPEGKGFPIAAHEQGKWYYVVSALNREEEKKFKIVKTKEGLYIKREM